MAEQEMVELKGTVEQVLYEDASSGFAVVEIDTGRIMFRRWEICRVWLLARR